MLLETKGKDISEIIQECLEEQQFWYRKKIKYEIHSKEEDRVWEGTGEILQVNFYPELMDKIYLIRNNDTGIKHMVSPLDYRIEVEVIEEGDKDDKN